jgi:hypothetical protein
MENIGPPPRDVARQIPRLALIAGAGQAPFLVARAAKGFHIPVTVYAIEGFTDPEFADKVEVEGIHWFTLGEVAKALEHLRATEIRHVVMIGKVSHEAIWHYREFDETSRRLLDGMTSRKADGVLGTIVNLLKAQSIEVIDSTLLLGDCMPGPGLLTKKRPLTEREQKDIDFGLPLAREIAGMEIGQTIVVKDLSVVAVEGMEGTDETIRRAGGIARGGIVVVKVARPRQDWRFDVPVIGPDTVRSLQQAGGGVLAIEAGSTLFLDQEEAVSLAESSDVAIVAV